MSLLSRLFGSSTSNSYMGAKVHHTRTKRSKRKRRIARDTQNMNRRKAKTWKK